MRRPPLGTQLPAMPPGANFFNFKRRKIVDNETMAPDTTDKPAPMIINFYDPSIRGEDARRRSLDSILDWQDYQLERSHDYIQILFPLPEGSPFNFHAPVIDRQVIDAIRSRAELQTRLRESFVRMLSFYGFEISGEQKVKVETEEASIVDQTVRTGGQESEDNAQNNDEYANVQHEAEAKSIAITMEQPKEEKDSNSQTTTTGAVKREQLQPPRPLTIVRASHWKEPFSNWAVHFDHNHLRMTRILRSLRVLGLQAECDAFYTALRDTYNDPRININERTMNYWTKAVKQPLYIAPDGERVPWLKRWEEETDAKREETENPKGK